MVAAGGAVSAGERIPAFPGAEGFGAQTVGGRRGRVIQVTTLNDSGPGSLRAAVEAAGPRLVVFRTGGTIELQSPLAITHPFITIAGQTAPGGGVTLKNSPANPFAPLQVKTHDVVIRYLRSRPGPSGKPSSNVDALTIADPQRKVSNVIVDHCSFSWSTDEVVNVWYDAKDVTLQWCIMSEGLDKSTNPEGPASRGPLLGGRGSERISFHHNLIAHNRGRNPMIKSSGVVDVVNNVVHAPATIEMVVSDEFARVPANFVGNVVQAPCGDGLVYGLWPLGGQTQGFSLFVQGNLGPFRTNDDQKEELWVRPRGRPFLASSRHPAPPVTTTTAREAYQQVLAGAGCTVPQRDPVDERVLKEVGDGASRIIDDPSEVGGWPALAPGTSSVDTDHDGMPDDWETQHSLNPRDPADGPGDTDGDGYTNVEEYLNGAALTSDEVRMGGPQATDADVAPGKAEKSTARTMPAKVIGPSTASGTAAQTVQVGRWDRFEATIPNARRYADPYADVTLKVTYTRPDGRRVAFWGFHDGGTTWRIRFMPDQTGRWRYSAAFSDGAAGASGEFECVPSSLPGLIAREEANPIWFGYRGGEPVLIRSFHVGDRFFAANWPANKRTAFLDWAQQQGYNMLSIASHYLNRSTKGRGAGWQTPALWPLNAGEYRRMEAVLDDLARRRILVFPFAGFFGRDSNFPREAAGQQLLLRYTLARLGPYWNLLLNVGGPEPMLRNNPYLTRAEIDRLGEEIRRLDPFGHLLSVHNPTGDDPFRDSAWTTYGILQGPKTTDRAKLAAGLRENHHPSRPLFAQETLWPGNKYHPAYSDDDIRKNAWVILMGATALNFADMNGDSSSGFSGTMELADRVQSRHDIVKRIWDFFETVPYHRMRPRPDLTSAGYCLAEPGRRYLVYLETPQKVTVQVTPGEYRVEWIDARDPRQRRSGGSTRDGARLTPPEGGDDWLLQLTASVSS